MTAPATAHPPMHMVSGIADSAFRQISALLAYHFDLGDFQLGVGGVAAAILTMLVVWMISRLAQRGFMRYAEQRDVRTRAAIYTVSRISRYALITLGVLMALGALGIPISRFAVLAGAIGVGLGFGLQAIFSNFVSGLILLFDRSLKVGDFVELASGVHGEVRDINIRATRITTNDNIVILVPNSEFVTGRVVNWTWNEALRRTRIPFVVAYGTDKELVKKAALEAAAEVPFTLSQEGPRSPKVWLVAFGESSLNFELAVWLTAEATKRPAAVKAAYNWALETALRRHGIELPYPQRELRVRSLFGLEGKEALAALRGERQASAPGQSPAPASNTSNDAIEDVLRPSEPSPAPDSIEPPRPE
jgi:small-conductance mechanosensitive channel